MIVDGFALGDAYYNRAIPIVEMQLVRGGVRLAGQLNNLPWPAPSPPAPEPSSPLSGGAIAAIAIASVALFAGAAFFCRRRIGVCVRG